MKCWHCNSELRWGGDQMLSEQNGDDDEFFSMVTNLTCNKCKSEVVVYLPKKEESKNNEKI